MEFLELSLEANSTSFPGAESWVSHTLNAVATAPGSVAFSPTGRQGKKASS